MQSARSAEKILSYMCIFSIYYSSIGNCRRPTLFQTGPQIFGATLKNIATLFPPKRENVLRMLKRRDIYIVFLHKRWSDAYCVSAQYRWSDAKNLDDANSIPPRRDVADAFLQLRQLSSDEYMVYSIIWTACCCKKLLLLYIYSHIKYHPFVYSALY